MLIAIIVLDLLFSLNLRRGRHVQRVGIHPRLPMGRDFSSVSAILSIEEKHQARLAGSVGAKYEEHLASFELKLLDAIIPSGKVQIERHEFLGFRKTLHYYKLLNPSCPVLALFAVGDVYVSRPVPKLGPFEIGHKSET